MGSEAMKTRSAMQWMFVVGITGLVAACGMAKSTPGEDPRTETNATQVTWTDGKPAIAISCKEPGACQTRAVAMCSAAAATTRRSRWRTCRRAAT